MAASKEPRSGAGSWSIGLANSQNLYLSAEKFQFKVNASGKTMKMKQIWTIEQQGEDQFAIRSWTGRYLGCDKNGVITANAEEIGRDNVFSFINQGNERFEVRSSQGHCLCGSHDSIAGKLREPKPEGWTIHLAIVPQINLRNIQRKAFARTNGSQFCAKEEIPWGQDCIILLQYSNGKYCFRDVNNHYLSREGNLKPSCDDDCLFVLFFNSGNLAFRDSQGKFLSCVGPQATLQSSKKPDVIGQSELFEIHNAKPQFSFLAFNQKFLSNKQGTDVRANQFEVENTEIFQLEAADPTDMSGNVKWNLLGSNKLYWNTQANSLACTSDSGSSEASQFDLIWKKNKIALRCSNGKLLQARSGGQLSPSGTSEDEESCLYVMQMVNRPLIAFNGCYGFIGIKGPSGVLECNRSQAEFFTLVHKDQTYYIQINEKYWKMSDNDSISATSNAPIEFAIEFRGHNRVCIVAPNGQYLRGAQNGGLTATGGTKVEENTLWTI